MKKLVNEFLTMSLTASVVLIIVGAILLILPELSLSVMCYAISAILIINGIMDRIAQNPFILLWAGIDWKMDSLVYHNFDASIYKRCHRDNCWRFFEVSATNSKRKYCSPECQNADSQKRHRRKKAK